MKEIKDKYIKNLIITIIITITSLTNLFAEEYIIDKTHSIIIFNVKNYAQPGIPHNT